jgi:hypothetical protein
MFIHLRAGDRSTYPVAAVLGGNVRHARQSLDIDDEIRLDKTGIQLHQDVRSAPQNPSNSSFFGQQPNSVL